MTTDTTTTQVDLYEQNVTKALRAGIPALQEFRRARAAADAAYTALTDTADTMWRAALLRLTHARTVALTAAAELDRRAHPIATAWEMQSERVLEKTRRIADIAAAAGLDITGWDSVNLHLEDFRDRGGYSHLYLYLPTREELIAEYAQQDASLAEVARLITTAGRTTP